MNGLACELVSLYEMEIVEWQDSMLNHMAAIHESKTGKGKKVRGFLGRFQVIHSVHTSPFVPGIQNQVLAFFSSFRLPFLFLNGMGFFSHHRHGSQAEKAEPTHRKNNI